MDLNFYIWNVEYLKTKQLFWNLNLKDWLNTIKMSFMKMRLWDFYDQKWQLRELEVVIRARAVLPCEGAAMPWGPRSAFDFLVSASSFRMKIKDLKSWIALFPKTSLIYLPVTGCWHTATLWLLPGITKNQFAAQGV